MNHLPKVDRCHAELYYISRNIKQRLKKYWLCIQGRSNWEIEKLEILQSNKILQNKTTKQTVKKHQYKWKPK
jgi:hypothetical protein